jgi:hypothetical protein
VVTNGTNRWQHEAGTHTLITTAVFILVDKSYLCLAVLAVQDFSNYTVFIFKEIEISGCPSRAAKCKSGPVERLPAERVA